MTKNFNEQNENPNTDPQSEQKVQYQENNQTNPENIQQDYSSITPIPEPQKKSLLSFLSIIAVIALVVIIGFKEHLFRLVNEFTHHKPYQEISKTIPQQQNNENLQAATPTNEHETLAPTPTTTTTTTSTPNSTMTPTQKQEIENVVKEFIQNNPNVILEALKSMEQQMAKERSAKAQNYIKSNINTIIENKPYLGNKNGSIVITKFFDYKCGYCKKAHTAIETLIKETPDLKVVLVELPIMGQQSLIATQASLAVFNTTPTKFAKFNSDLINAQNIDENTIKILAMQNNINANALMNSMKSQKVEQEIDSNMAIARETGLQGVPAFIIGDEFIPGFVDYDTLKSKISKLQRQYTKP